jgi:hypothetical protein
VRDGIYSERGSNVREGTFSYKEQGETKTNKIKEMPL